MSQAGAASNSGQGFESVLEFTGGTGTTGAFPVVPDGGGAVKLTSLNSTIKITGSANSLDFEAGSSIPTSFVTNNGTATPVSNVLDILTTGTTVLFSGSTFQVTQGFAISNLIMGSKPSVSGGGNVGLGFNALSVLTSGNSNTAIGASSGGSITSGIENTFLGNSVAPNNNGSGNTLIGYDSGLNYTGTESFNILINNTGVLGETSATRIGATQTSCYISGISGVTTSNTQYVTINTSTGQLGSTSGSLITTYTLAQTGASWTPNPNTKIVEFYVWGSGAGGGSGRCGVSASAGSGSGGGAGYFNYQKITASNLTSSPYTITVGAGAAGGISVNAVTTNGNPGTAGNPSSVGSIITAPGGTAGVGGTTTTAAGQTSFAYNLGVVISGVSSGAGQQNTNGTATANQMYAWSSGGGGGAAYATTTARTGGAGGNITDFAGNVIVTGGLAGANTGAIAGNGNAPSSQLLIIGGSGGGGGGHDGTTVAGSGGNGATPGGGGGGGAGNLSSNASGAGGNGGDGLIIIVEYF